MCGIAGYISLRGKPVDPVYLKTMADVQRHRGPDQEGEYCDGTIAMSSQRLAIVDPAGGNQPVFNEDGSVVVVYNGEIYNHRDLRRSLQAAGHRFKSNCDTEVLVHAYEEQDVGLLSRLSGMFAFALWDRSRRRLILARDHLGMKPLYFAEHEGMLWFASEVKALASLPQLVPALDASVLAEYLLYQNILSNRSLFRGVRKLRPGHYLIVERGCVTEHQYWDLELGRVRKGSLEDHLEQYRLLVEAAVERHLMGDVQIGTYLSGGYDSTAVSLIAARHTKGPVHAFTGAFREGGFYDERPAAREVASRGGALLHEIVIDAETFWSLLDQVCYALDEPSVGSGAIPQYLVAREAAQHVKVVLTGHGGDELLLGYEAYRAVYLRQLLDQFPRKLREACSLIRGAELPRLAYFLLAGDPVVRCGLLRLFRRSTIHALLRPTGRVDDAEMLEPLRAIVEPVRDASPLERTIYLYLKTYLPTLLIQEDKVGMAHSVESRMPLCDRELVEFLMSVPARHKLYRGRLKFFPRTALRDLYPPVIFRQPKRGFPTPIAHWFRRELRSRVEARLFGPDSRAADVFDVATLRRLWKTFQLLPGDSLVSYYLANQLYSVLTVVVWFELFVCGGGRRAQLARAWPGSRGPAGSVEA